ncbi:MAG: arginase family protein [Chitinophagaceae bacterium]|nr:arginase family protein [Chitinophagaceae bacterium]
MLYPHFRFYSKQDILNITRLRRFETKLGECVHVIQEGTVAEMLLQSKAKYVVVGIPEDIGALGNYDIGGADTAWLPFLQAFCNVQSTDFFSGEEILVLGQFDFSDIKALIGANAKNQEELADACRHAVQKIIDPEVEEIIKLVTQAGNIPVVIGGGHNNSYPLIKGAAKGLYKSGKTNTNQINVINADAHARYRVIEGRHSGNAFRYAKDDGFLNRYVIIGLYENYNSQRMLDELYSDVQIQYTTYEDMFIREKLTLKEAMVQAVSFTGEAYTGIELDMESIQFTPGGVAMPGGFTVLQARQYVSFLSHHSHIAYLHIAGGAAQLANGRQNPFAGKLICDMAVDFMKVNKW